ncbi:MAG: glycine cleavage system protein GcvH [Candidatus Omnitrophota bacterium]|jgi:glycine cleavage system H protein
MIPQDLKYTREHEWVKIEGDNAVFGITDHAQSALGDITFIELPAKDGEIKQTDSIATIESVKAASDIYAPLSGKVLEVNETLQDNPEVINSSPYEDGWICRVNISDSEEQDSLMSADEYEKYLKENE